MRFFNHFDLLDKGARAPSFRLFSGERVGNQGPGPATKYRRNFTRLSFWMKSLQAAVLAVAVCFSLGATDAELAVQRPGTPADVHLRLRGDCWASATTWAARRAGGSAKS